MEREIIMSGKFSSELAERLYEWTLDSSEDASLGESEAFGWFALFAEKRAILTEDSQGFVDVAEYPSEAEARAAWQNLETAYGEWCDQGITEALDTSVCDGLFLIINTARHNGASLPDMEDVREHVHACASCRERNLWALDA